MPRNRETVLIEESLVRLKRTGKVLFFVFAGMAVLFGAVAVLFAAMVFVGAELFENSFEAVLSAVYGAVEMAVAGAVFLICALTSRDASRGLTPFSQKQIKRIKAAGWLLLGYVLFCLIWEPFVCALTLSLNNITFDVYTAEQPLDIDINYQALLTSCAFFLFSYILSYGCTLQQLSDETG